jgi:hypothetical protein
MSRINARREVVMDKANGTTPQQACDEGQKAGLIALAKLRSECAGALR